MIPAILIGALAACISVLPSLIRAFFPGVAWFAPSLILGTAALAMVLQRFVIDRKSGYRGYDGLADVLIHIHSPAQRDSSLRWLVRAAISFLLTLFGAAVGPEGAAVEAGHALALGIRSRSARWFEQRRRTDAACALSAGIAATFSAPFAAVLLPMELGIGGRTLSSATSAITAFLGVRYLSSVLPGEQFSVELFDVTGALASFRFGEPREWVAVILIAVLAGVIAAGVIRFIRYSQESLLDLFQTQAWMRTLAGGILLFLLMLVYKTGHQSSLGLLQEVAWARRSVGEVALLLFTSFLAIALILSAFGTIGIFWPLFAMGSFLGFLVNHGVFHALEGFGPAAALAGASAFWGAIIGAPIAGGIVAFEMTHDVYVLLPCLLSALIAWKTKELLKTESLVERDLRARGLALVEGRAASVLDGLFVRDAMVTDHETVHEQEPIADIHARLLKSKYPFLPVVNSQEKYIGFLTVDMIQESWHKQGVPSSNAPLSRLLEAKDLLYRSGFSTPTVRPGDRLSATAGLFSEVPCIPVIAEDGRVVGLLFVYSVRLSYDREVAKRSLAFQLDEG